jgi:hypothetical protein
LHEAEKELSLSAFFRRNGEIMNKRNVLSFFLLLTILVTAGAEISLVDSPEGGPQFSLAGDLTVMYTLGPAEETQKISTSGFDGIYEEKKNGFYTAANLGFRFYPVSSLEIYAKFLARTRPGSPYIPLQMTDAGKGDFSLSLDSIYGRLGILENLGLTLPVGLYLKAGKFDTGPSNFQGLSAYRTESVMLKLRTKNTYAFQTEAIYALPVSGSLSLSLTVNQQLNEELDVLYDTDGTMGKHGDPVLDQYAIPFLGILKLKDLGLPFGKLSAELLYARNAEHIYSGNSLGLGAGMTIPLSASLSIPLGLGVAFYEKNIDALASTAIPKKPSGLALYDGDTIGFRQTLRAGLGGGVRYTIGGFLATEGNLGFSYSQIAHIYRDTLQVVSASIDVKAIAFGRYFLGGGFIAGALNGPEWKTKQSVDPNMDKFNHVFKFSENMGFEIFGGVQFNKAKFVLGYNLSRGLAMTHHLEALPDAQIKYRQKDSASSGGLFETGGVFMKFVTAW